MEYTFGLFSERNQLISSKILCRTLNTGGDGDKLFLFSARIEINKSREKRTIFRKEMESILYTIHLLQPISLFMVFTSGNATKRKLTDVVYGPREEKVKNRFFCCCRQRDNDGML